MTFEEWLENHMNKAEANRDETAIIAPTSWGHAFDSGYYSALQMVFASLPASIAFAPMETAEVTNGNQ